MKHRKGGSSKIKYEHHIIKDVRAFLESIEDWGEIKSIIPGRISPRKASHELLVTSQYTLKNGLKCLAKSGAAVQELFFVTDEPEILSEKLRKKQDK